MKGMNVVVLFAFVLLLILPSNIAAGYQGFEWAVEEGDTADYHLKLRTTSRVVDFASRTWENILDIQMEIIELGNISLNYTQMSLWGFTTFLMRSWVSLKNGTLLKDLNSFSGIEGSIARDYISDIAAVPVGNWSHANSLVEAAEASVIDDEIYWGYEKEDQNSGYLETWKWKKSDGTLSYVEIHNGQTETMSEYMIFDLLIQRSEGNVDPVLIIAGVGTAAVVTIAILWFYWHNIRK